MTLLDFEELTAYWADHPPAHILLAAYLGLGNEKRTRKRSGTDASATSGPLNSARADIGSVLAELGPGFGSGDVHAGLAPVMLDFAELGRRAAAAPD